VGSLAFVARSQARRRWRAVVALTLFAGLLGGLAISLVAGSRRSASVVDRYIAASHRPDVEVYSEWLDREQVLAIPGVERADPTAYVGMVLAEPSGGSGPGINGNAVDFDALDPTWRIIEGERPDGSDPNEILVNVPFVEQFDRSVGDTLDVQMFGKEQAEAVSRGDYDADGPRYRLRITGVIRPPMDVVVDAVSSVGTSSSASANGVGMSDAFYRDHRDEFLDFGQAFLVTLADGEAGRDAFAAAVADLTPPGEEPAEIGPAQETARRASLSTPVDVETNVLLVLGLSLALAAAIAGALILRAEQRALDGDTPALRTLGLSGPQLGAIAVLRTAPAAVGGAVVAVALAVAFSARYPVGIGRQLELQPGTDFNLAVVGLGALVIVGLILALAFALGMPRRDRRTRPASRRTLARSLAAGGAPTDLVLGTQLAFERGRGVRSVPARAAIAVGAGALAVVTAVAVYVGGVDELHSVPDAHGWRWDAAIGNVNFPLAPETAEALAEDERIERQMRGTFGDATVNGQATEFLVIDPRADAPPRMLSGRLPETASEIALGRAALDDLGVAVGDVVRFSVAGGDLGGGERTRPRRMRVVGETLAPIFGESDVGEVGLVTFAGVEAAGGDPTPKFVLVRVRGDDEADLVAIHREYTEEIITDTVPARIVNLQRVRRLPLLGMLVAGFLGTVVLVYTLAVSARARSRELAVLRALGLSARRVGAVLAWQGAVLGAGILVIGLPLGWLLGVAAWNRVADGLGVDTGAVVQPWVWLCVPAALVVAMGAALVSARRARRLPVAELLRVE
jgi:hypothetical protein